MKWTWTGLPSTTALPQLVQRLNLQMRSLENFNGNAEPVTTLKDDATPSVSGGHLFVTGGTTAITDFDDGVIGQELEILAAHSVTITDGSPIILAGGADYTMTDSDTLTLRMFNSQVWQEIARSVN